MRSVFAYIRVSTARQGERGSSLQEQRTAIESYARRFDLLITEWFEERETAAKRGRRGFTRMLRLLDRKKAAGVIIHKIDRSARNLKDWADLGELIDHGVEVHFAHESLDLHSRGGRLSADIQAVVAADYIRNLRDEVRKGFYGRLKQGFLPLPAPLGYRNNGGGKEKTLDPMTAPFVRQAFELYASGAYSLDMLCDRMHSLGLRNRRGGRITRSGMATLLSNEFYIGIIHLRRSGERFLGKHPHLVSKSLFDTVQDVKHGRLKRGGLKHAFPYRKLARCARCRYFLVGETQKGIRYYRCHTKGCQATCLREDDLEQQIRSGLAQFSVTPDELPLLEQDLEAIRCEAQEDKASQVKGLRLSLAQLDERMARLTDAYIDRLIDREAFEQRNAGLLKEHVAIEQEIEKMATGESSAVQETVAMFELIRRLSQATNEVFPEELVELLKSASSNFLVEGKTAQISWKSGLKVLMDARLSAAVERNEPHVEPSGHGSSEIVRRVNTYGHQA